MIDHAGAERPSALGGVSGGRASVGSLESVDNGRILSVGSERCVEVCGFYHVTASVTTAGPFRKGAANRVLRWG